MTMVSDGMLLGAGAGDNIPLLVSTAFGGQSNGTQVTINKPVGTQQGDHMLLFVFGASFSTLSISGGSLANVFYDVATALKFALFRQIAGASEPSTYTITTTTGTRTAIMASYRGGQGLIDVRGSSINTQTGVTDSTAVGISPTTSGVLLSAHGIGTNTSASGGPPTGMTKIQGVEGLIAVSMVLNELTPSPNGATGNKVQAWAGSTTPARGGVNLQIY